MAMPLQTTILLQPPPLVLVHGIWGDPYSTWGFSNTPNTFEGWLANNYPSVPVDAADYSQWNYLSFSAQQPQTALEVSIANALYRAAKNGTVARSADVVAHSMGGLVTRYFIDNINNVPYSVLFGGPHPIHQLITIGTPHLGTPLASSLENSLPNTPLINGSGSAISAICVFKQISGCTLKNFFQQYLKKPVDTGVQSLIPGTAPLRNLTDSKDFKSIDGLAEPGSATEVLLNLVTVGFTGQTIETIFSPEPSDTIVPTNSQLGSAPEDIAGVSFVVHVALAPGDTSETASSHVWSQTAYWLMGGSGTAPVQSAGIAKVRPARSLATQPTSSAAPVLDLTGYTQVASSNFSLSPVSGSSLTINSAATISATSSTKTITEVLLFQTVADPTDVALLYSTQAPFRIIFIPKRMGSTNFVAFAVFSDMTYAVTGLNYTFQVPGNPLAFNLVNAPVASLPVGSSAIVTAQALFSNGPVDIGPAATYKVRSGATSVFGVDSVGTVTANGPGSDWLDVSYNGVSASAQISVGTCAYSLSPTNQLVAYGGGSVSVQVTTQNGCGWTADTGGAAWLRPINASGIGSGTVALTATANTTGAIQTAIITVASQDVAIIQPATSCTYTLNETQISAPGTGASGSVSVTTSCPIVASSSTPWVTVTPLSSSVAYNVGANTGSSPRSAFIAIGNQMVTVNQAGLTPTFSISANPSTVSISAPGRSGSTSITVSPSGGFAGTVNLSCSVAFAGTGTATDSPTCSLNPSQVNITGVGGATSTLNISTTAPQSAALRRERSPSGRGLVARGGLAILFCACLVGFSTRRRESSSIIGLVVTIALIGTVACGGNGGAGGGGAGNKNPGTTIGSYTVTVTAMGGGVSSSSSVTVTLQ
jgi:hypothetical protein